MFTREEAEETLALARSSEDYWLTLGERIYFQLPDWLANEISGPDNDMYWAGSDQEAIEMLMALVDEG